MSLEPTTLPKEDQIAVIAVTSTAATTNLAAAGQLGALVNAGGPFEIISDAVVHYKLAYASGTEVAAAATTGSTRGYRLPADTPVQFYFETRKEGGLNTFLSMVTASTATVRVAYVGRKKV